jgi:hypothetical protein
MIFSENRYPPPDQVRGRLFRAHALPQAKERKDGQDHDNQPDEIDQPIHVRLRQVCSSQLQTQNCRKPKPFLSRVDVVA